MGSKQGWLKGEVKQARVVTRSHSKQRAQPVPAFVSFVQKLETYFHNIVVNNMPTYLFNMYREGSAKDLHIILYDPIHKRAFSEAGKTFI